MLFEMKNRSTRSRQPQGGVTAPPGLDQTVDLNRATRKVLRDYLKTHNFLADEFKQLFALGAGGQFSIAGKLASRIAEMQVGFRRGHYRCGPGERCCLVFMSKQRGARNFDPWLTHRKVTIFCG